MREYLRFSSLRELLAKANEEKSGDHLAGIAASSERERVAAKRALADLPLAELLNNPLIPPETDEVSRLLLESHDSSAFGPVRSMTVGDSESARSPDYGVRHSYAGVLPRAYHNSVGVFGSRRADRPALSICGRHS